VLAEVWGFRGYVREIEKTVVSRRERGVQGVFDDGH